MSVHPKSAGAFTGQPASDSGAVKGDLVKRWDAALAQVRAHTPRCTCEPCKDARGFLERIWQAISPDGETSVQRPSSRDETSVLTSKNREGKE